MTVSAFSFDIPAACAGAASETERHKKAAIEEITLVVCFKIHTQVVEIYDVLRGCYRSHTINVKTSNGT